MSAHTPGPWSTYVNKWPDEIVIRSMFQDGSERAKVATTNHGNANLIAAAPELLEALIRLLDDEDEHLTLQGRKNLARAAIAKAGGAA